MHKVISNANITMPTLLSDSTEISKTITYHKVSTKTKTILTIILNQRMHLRGLSATAALKNIVQNTIEIAIS